MKKNNLKPKEVLERYHEKYLSYRLAFETDKSNSNLPESEIKELIDSGVDPESDEFIEKMIPIMVVKPQRRTDVNTAAIKFFMYCDFYIMTEGELPEDIYKSYNELVDVRRQFKFFNSIENGEFKTNEIQKIDSNLKNYLKAVYAKIKNQN